ncbi:MAG: helix-turn-helix transcriptional regulator [Candidatus Coproplasma sp.]
MARIIDGNKMNMIGANVAKRRKELKMSQQKLSDKLELYAVYVCRGSISRIEDYSRTVTDIELYAIAKVLNVEISDLFDKDAFNFDND